MGIWLYISEYFNNRFAGQIFMPPPLGDGALRFTLVCTSVRPVYKIFVKYISACVCRIGLIFGLKLYQGELYRVSPFQVCHSSTSCLAGASVSHRHIFSVFYYSLYRKILLTIFFSYDKILRQQIF